MPASALHVVNLVSYDRRRVIQVDGRKRAGKCLATYPSRKPSDGRRRLVLKTGLRGRNTSVVPAGSSIGRTRPVLTGSRVAAYRERMRGIDVDERDSTRDLLGSLRRGIRWRSVGRLGCLHIVGDVAEGVPPQGRLLERDPLDSKGSSTLRNVTLLRRSLSS